MAYHHTFSQQQIGELRAFGVLESEIQEMLILHFDFKIPVPEAHQQILGKRAAGNCPYCSRIVSNLAKYLQNRHINACKKKRAAKSPVDATPPASPSTPGPVPNQPASSSSMPGSSAPQGGPSTSSHKRTIDKADGQSSDAQLPEKLKTTEGPRAKRQKKQKNPSPPKRQRVVKEMKDDAYRAKATLDGLPGTLEIREDRTFVGWIPVNGTKTVVITLATITEMQSEEASDEKLPKLAIFGRGSSSQQDRWYTFEFSSPKNAEVEATTVRNVLTPFVKANIIEKEEAELISRIEAECDSHNTCEASPQDSTQPTEECERGYSEFIESDDEEVEQAALEIVDGDRETYQASNAVQEEEVTQSSVLPKEVKALPSADSGYNTDNDSPLGASIQPDDDNERFFNSPAQAADDNDSLFEGSDYDFDVDALQQGGQTENLDGYTPLYNGSAQVFSCHDTVSSTGEAEAARGENAGHVQYDSESEISEEEYTSLDSTSDKASY